MDATTLLSLIVFLPCAGMLGLLFIPNEKTDLLRIFTLGVTVGVLILTSWMFFAPPSSAGGVGFAEQTAPMQNVVLRDWIPSFDINYYMALDGISFPLVVLTAFICVLAMWASWGITKQLKTYCILFLMLETGMLGVFMALDFFLFFVFWEVMLLPMYFLIGVWGGPRREYAAIKFFIYTMAGGVLMLIAILMLYFASDVKALSDQQLIATNEVSKSISAEAQTEAIKKIRDSASKVHTFNILALQQLGQMTKEKLDDQGNVVKDPKGNPIRVGQFDELMLGKPLQWWAFVLLFIGFAVKVPSVPVHTWLPDAHVEAPTPISMILAGILLKMGGYGIIRICYPICPAAGYELADVCAFIGVLSIVYGALAAMAQTDFKRLVAYSSVSHMGYVVLGMACWSAQAGSSFDTQAWKMGMNGAMFQMIAHGLSSAGMFFMVGVIYDRVHHRNLDEFGGLFGVMPRYSAIAFGIFFAGLGLPGLCGFWGEVWVVLSVWKYSHLMAIITASAVILTAGYILWTLQRVYLGAEYKGPHGEHLHEMTTREVCIAAPLLAGAILFGVHPNLVLKYMEPSVSREVDDLAAWTRINRPAAEKAVAQPAAAEPAKAAEAPAKADPKVSLLPANNPTSATQVVEARTQP